MARLAILATLSTYAQEGPHSPSIPRVNLAPPEHLGPIWSSFGASGSSKWPYLAPGSSDGLLSSSEMKLNGAQYGQMAIFGQMAISGHSEHLGAPGLRWAPILLLNEAKWSSNGHIWPFGSIWDLIFGHLRCSKWVPDAQNGSYLTEYLSQIWAHPEHRCSQVLPDGQIGHIGHFEHLCSGGAPFPVNSSG